VRIDGKVAVVVGASRGIGLAIVREFAAAGAKLVFCARSEGTIDDLADELTASGHEAVAIKADISRRKDCKTLIDTAIERYGRIDILVNNAAIAGPTKPISELEPEEWEQVMAINVTSLYHTIHFTTQHMIEQGDGGTIINLGSLTGKRPLEKRTPYAASKMAVVGLTRTVALEMGAHNIRCNVISPGPVAGARVDEVITAAASSAGKSEQEIRDGILSWSPLHEMVTDEDVAHMALYLSSDFGKRITGQDINVNAGAIMY
jgi:NAD(P)-dependent dehydrogenase (short-subunit alcohol dehydrogenase family)